MEEQNKTDQPKLVTLIPLATPIDSNSSHTFYAIYSNGDLFIGEFEKGGFFWAKVPSPYSSKASHLNLTILGR